MPTTGGRYEKFARAVEHSLSKLLHPNHGIASATAAPSKAASEASGLPHTTVPTSVDLPPPPPAGSDPLDSREVHIDAEIVEADPQPEVHRGIEGELLVDAVVSLSYARSVCDLVQDIGDVIEGFPYMKIIASMTSKVLEVVQQVRDNQDGWETLARDTLRIFRAIESFLLENEVIIRDDRIWSACEDVQRDLKTLVTVAEEQMQQGLFSRTSNRNALSALQQRLRSILDQLLRIFQIQLTGSTYVRVVAVEAKIDQAGQDRLVEKLERCVVKHTEWGGKRECLPDTRAATLDALMAWATSVDSPPIAYLCGIAGLGKSTVSETFAHRLEDARLLGASYFFSRDETSRATSENLFATIAYRLQTALPSFREQLCKVLRREIPSHTNRQYEDLVRKPLESSDPPQHPFVVIIDAMDECGDFQEFLPLLLNSIPSLKAYVRLFYTSRPQASIDRVLHPPDVCNIQIDREASSNQDDVREFLDVTLLGLARKLQMPPEWPDLETRRKILSSARGLFIWVVTVCRWLEDSDAATIEEDLRTITDSPSEIEDNAEAGLHSMYQTILVQAWSTRTRGRYQSAFRPVLATILGAHRRLSTQSIAALLELDDASVDVVVRSLRSVVDVGYGNRLSFIHPSFSRFLTGSCDDTRFKVDGQEEADRFVLHTCCGIIHRELHAPSAVRDWVRLYAELYDAKLSRGAHALLNGALDSLGLRKVYGLQYAIFFVFTHCKKLTRLSDVDQKILLQFCRHDALLWAATYVALRNMALPAFGNRNNHEGTSRRTLETIRFHFACLVSAAKASGNAELLNAARDCNNTVITDLDALLKPADLVVALGSCQRLTCAKLEEPLHVELESLTPLCVATRDSRELPFAVSRSLKNTDALRVVADLSEARQEWASGRYNCIIDDTLDVSVFELSDLYYTYRDISWWSCFRFARLAAFLQTLPPSVLQGVQLPTGKRVRFRIAIRVNHDASEEGTNSKAADAIDKVHEG